MERITGPYKGYYIAAFTLRREGLHGGYAAICVDKPAMARQAKGLEQVASEGSYGEEERALQAAEFQARFIIDGLTPNWAPFTAPGMLSR